jgi:hypothetical protein
MKLKFTTLNFAKLATLTCTLLLSFVGYSHSKESQH